MLSRHWWKKLYSNAQGMSHAVNSKWHDLAEFAGGAEEDCLPDATILEDRILFSAAPIDAALAVEAQTGSSPTTPNDMSIAGALLGEATGDQPASPPQGAAALDSGLFAPDAYVSVNAEDRIVAMFVIGGGADNPLHRNIGWGVDRTGWEVFIERKLEPLLDAGVTRVSLQAPFGQRSYIVDPETGEASAAPGQWGYQFDAYLDAQTETPKVTEDFVSAFQKFFAKQETAGQLQEIIPYVGSPRLDPDQVALTDNPDAWWDRAYEIITPLLDAGFRSIGFDASARATPDMLDSQLYDVLRYPELRDPVRDAPLIELVGDERVEVYLEAMPRHDTGRTDFPLLLLDKTYVHQDPDRPGAHFEARQEFYEHDRLTGEIIRVVTHGEWKTEGTAPVERILSEGNTVATSPSFLLDPGRGGAETLDAFVDQLNLPTLPTLVDLDPDDENPQNATYEITDGPRFGTLTPNRFHADVFTYVPDPFYSGIDTFEYVVTDASGGQESAVVTLFVSTDVVLPPDPPTTPTTPVEPPTSGSQPPVPTPGTPSGSETPAPPGVSGPPPSDNANGPADEPFDPSPPETPSPPVATPQPDEPPVATSPPSVPSPADPLPPNPLPPKPLPVDTPPPQSAQPEPTQPTPPADPIPPAAGETGDPPSSGAEPPHSGEPSAAQPDPPPPNAPGPGNAESDSNVNGPAPPSTPQPTPTSPGPATADRTTGPDTPPLAASDARRSDPAPPMQFGTMDKIQELVSQARRASASGSLAPIPVDAAQALIFLPHANRLADSLAPVDLSASRWNGGIPSDSASTADELEKRSSFAPAKRSPAFERPDEASSGLHDGSVLQFLVRSVGSWLPRR